MARTLLLAVLLLASSVPTLAAEEEGVSPDDLALQRIRAFERALRGDGDEAEAIAELAAMDHPLVARRLVRLAGSGEDFELRAEALRALPLQRASASFVCARVAKLLVAEAKYKKRALIELELDLNNDIVLDTPEAKRCIARVVARDAMREAAVRCHLSFESWKGLPLKVLLDLLESGHDGLVTALLETFAKRNDWRALKKIQELYVIYPSPRKWSTSHIYVRDRFNDTRAKKRWLARFGDPNYFRARPAVVAAIRETLRRITGEAFDTPDELKAYLRRSEVKRRTKIPPRTVARATR